MGLQVGGMQVQVAGNAVEPSVSAISISTSHQKTFSWFETIGNGLCHKFSVFNWLFAFSARVNGEWQLGHWHYRHVVANDFGVLMLLRTILIFGKKLLLRKK